MEKQMAKKNSVKIPIFKKWWFWAVVAVIVIGSIGNTDSNNQGEEPDISKNNISQNETVKAADVSTTSSSANESDALAEPSKQELLNNFFVEIGTDVSSDSIEDIAKGMGLFISYKNFGTGTVTYKVAGEKEIANMYRPKKGSYVEVSFNRLKDTIREIIYFDEERMIAGYWIPGTGYQLVDYNYPQIVYCLEGSNEPYSSKVPISGAKAIIEYSSNENQGENLLEVLFASVTPEMTKDDLMEFVNTHKLSYNSRGSGNEKVIAYCHKIGDKYGEQGSYITFSEDEDGLITRMTYLYYPLNYKGYKASFYSERYAKSHSTPSGFVLMGNDEFTEYSSAAELLVQSKKLI